MDAHGGAVVEHGRGQAAREADKKAPKVDSEDQAAKGMRTKALIPFVLLSFGLSWGIIALMVVFYDQIYAIFGDFDNTNPLYLLAVYSPGIAAVLLVWRSYGLRGVGSFLRRLTLWRAPIGWWLFLVVGIPALALAGAALNGTIGDPLPFSAWQQAVPVILGALFFGPIEEFGWRGVGLPLLQRRFAPFWAGLILGAIWAAWHIPAFLLGGTAQSGWSFGPFFLGVVAISVILTPFFNAARGSLLVAVLYHFQMMNPLFPDAQPWDNLIFILVAAIIVWLNRRSMFERGQGVTDVLAPEDNAGLSGT